MYYLMESADWLLTLIIVLCLVVFFVGAHYLVLKFTPLKKTENEVASVVTHLIGMLYAVLLGFIAVNAWGDFDRSLKNAIDEENALADLYRIAENFPSKQASAIQKNIDEYAKLMVNVEWPAMQHGGQSEEAKAVVSNILDSIDQLNPSSVRESNLQVEGIKLVHDFLDARRLRLNKNQEGMPVMLILVILLGAVLMISFTFYLKQTNYMHQLFMTGVLSALVGLILSLIVEFEYPYRGKLSVPSTGWEVLMENIEKQQVY